MFDPKAVAQAQAAWTALVDAKEAEGIVRRRTKEIVEAFRSAFGDKYSDAEYADFAELLKSCAKGKRLSTKQALSLASSFLDLGSDEMTGVLK